MSRQDPWDERGWVSKYPDTNCVWYAGDRAGLVEMMLNQLDRQEARHEMQQAEGKASGQSIGVW